MPKDRGIILACAGWFHSLLLSCTCVPPTWHFRSFLQNKTTDGFKIKRKGWEAQRNRVMMKRDNGFAFHWGSVMVMSAICCNEDRPNYLSRQSSHSEQDTNYGLNTTLLQSSVKPGGGGCGWGEGVFVFTVFLPCKPTCTHKQTTQCVQLFWCSSLQALTVQRQRLCNITHAAPLTFAYMSFLSSISLF